MKLYLGTFARLTYLLMRHDGAIDTKLTKEQAKIVESWGLYVKHVCEDTYSVALTKKSLELHELER